MKKKRNAETVSLETVHKKRYRRLSIEARQEEKKKQNCYKDKRENNY